MIKLSNLTKTYEDHTIFSNLELTVDQGEFIAIMGESGCGKSTLLNLIGCLDRNFEGEILVDAINLKKLEGEKRQKFIRNHINYLFQNYALVEDKSVKYNLMLALKYTNHSAKMKETIISEILESVGLLDKLNKKVFSLSGGAQQRISLARSIIKPGFILLADEPTGNLDERNRDIIISLLKKHHNENRIVIIATHDAFVAEQCDRVVILKNQ